MNATRPISEYSRQELYDLIWSTPASKLATDFGISDVAIAKRCKHRLVPRPSRGYWAKVAAGRKPRKTPLPPTPDELFKQAAERAPKRLRLPENTDALLPLASELMNAITKAELDHYKRARVEQTTQPRVTVSRSLAERVAKAFHVLLKELQPTGITFHKYQGSYDGGYFKRRHDRLHVEISEDIVRPDGSRFNAPSWESPRRDEKPSGYLTFTFKPSRYSNEGTKQWSETPKLSLEQTLAQVVAGVRKHYLDLQERRDLEEIESAKRHAEWLERHREWEKQEAIRLQTEKARKHAEALAAVVNGRKVALLKAAENWRQSQTLLDFLRTCQTQWKNQSGTLTPEQTRWLTWANEIAVAMSPFSAGYPDATNDGAFDPTSIPPGGPYPATRRFAA